MGSGTMPSLSSDFAGSLRFEYLDSGKVIDYPLGSSGSFKSYIPPSLDSLKASTAMPSWEDLAKKLNNFKPFTPMKFDFDNFTNPNTGSSGSFKSYIPPSESVFNSSGTLKSWKSLSFEKHEPIVGSSEWYKKMHIPNLADFSTSSLNSSGTLDSVDSWKVNYSALKPRMFNSIRFEMDPQPENPLISSGSFKSYIPPSADLFKSSGTLSSWEYLSKNKLKPKFGTPEWYDQMNLPKTPSPSLDSVFDGNNSADPLNFSFSKPKPKFGTPEWYEQKGMMPPIKNFLGGDLTVRPANKTEYFNLLNTPKQVIGITHHPIGLGKLKIYDEDSDTEYGIPIRDILNKHLGEWKIDEK